MRLLVAVAMLFLGACASDRLAQPAPSFGVLKAIRAADFPAIAVGEIAARPADANFDRVMSFRGSTVRPVSGSFASDLRATVIAELTAAGRYDPDASTILSGELVENRAGENFKHGGGGMAAAFRLTKGQRVVFDKVIRTDLQWNSSFIGAVAVPNAFRAYGAMQNMLVERLVSDTDFRRAVKPQ